jgi:hypothetical protein
VTIAYVLVAAPVPLLITAELFAAASFHQLVFVAALPAKHTV